MKHSIVSNDNGSSKSTFSLQNAATSYPLRLSGRQLAQLNMPDFCPGCYWFERKYMERQYPFQIPMPGVFSTIDAFSKNSVHAYVDEFGRLPEGLPDVGLVSGYMESRKLHWRNFQLHDPETNITMTGSPDDVIILENGDYIILDYKTARYTKTQDKLFPLYEGQLNVYAYMAERLWGKPPAALYLVYFDPQSKIINEGFLDENESTAVPALSFDLKTLPVELHGEEFVRDLLRRGRAIYDEEQAPDHIDQCSNHGCMLEFVQTYDMAAWQMRQ